MTLLLCPLKVWKKKLQEEHEKLRSLSGEEREHAEKTANDRRVHPVDAPPGSLRARIFVQMTSTETSSKIAASDLLFNLCDDEGRQVLPLVPNETQIAKLAYFYIRMGFGPNICRTLPGVLCSSLV